MSTTKQMCRESVAKRQKTELIVSATPAPVEPLYVSVDMLAILVNYLWVTDLVNFMFVSKTAYQYFSSDIAWSKYTIDKKFLGSAVHFPRLPKRKQCMYLMALRQCNNIEECLDKILSMDACVMALIICRQQYSLSLGPKQYVIDNSNGVFTDKFTPTRMAPTDIVLPVVTCTYSRTYLPLLLRQWRIFVGMDYGYMNVAALADILSELLAELRILPFIVVANPK